MCLCIHNIICITYIANEWIRNVGKYWEKILACDNILVDHVTESSDEKNTRGKSLLSIKDKHQTVLWHILSDFGSLVNCGQASNMD